MTVFLPDHSSKGNSFDLQISEWKGYPASKLMNFKEFDNMMRRYEENLDQYILPDMYIVARLDGRSFSKYTKRKNFKKPFDETFRDMMVKTTKNLMENSGFRIVYGYTESDEISLLFHPEDNTFSRKTRKINTTLAGQASAFFSMLAGEVVTFDCRVIPLPNLERVADYFAWRQEDSHRNSLNGWCYWTLRSQGFSKRKATFLLLNKTIAYKNELLFQRGINYNTIPEWQKRGIGLYFKNIEKKGYNPITGEENVTTRKILFEDYSIPHGNEYREYIVNRL